MNDCWMKFCAAKSRSSVRRHATSCSAQYVRTRSIRCACLNAGVAVTLNTDDPVRIWTTIGREYAIAHELGFTEAELLMFTCHAIKSDGLRCLN